eukprot:Sdes_comp8870_c0_seq1m262
MDSENSDEPKFIIRDESPENSPGTQKDAEEAEKTEEEEIDSNLVDLMTHSLESSTEDEDFNPESMEIIEDIASDDISQNSSDSDLENFQRDMTGSSHLGTFKHSGVVDSSEDASSEENVGDVSSGALEKGGKPKKRTRKQSLQLHKKSSERNVDEEEEDEEEEDDDEDEEEDDQKGFQKFEKGETKGENYLKRKKRKKKKKNSTFLNVEPQKSQSRVSSADLFSGKSTESETFPADIFYSNRHEEKKTSINHPSIFMGPHSSLPPLDIQIFSSEFLQYCKNQQEEVETDLKSFVDSKQKYTELQKTLQNINSEIISVKESHDALKTQVRDIETELKSFIFDILISFRSIAALTRVSKPSTSNANVVLVATFLEEIKNVMQKKISASSAALRDSFEFQESEKIYQEISDAFNTIRQSELKFLA